MSTPGQNRLYLGGKFPREVHPLCINCLFYSFTPGEGGACRRRRSPTAVNQVGRCAVRVAKQ